YAAAGERLSFPTRRSSDLVVVGSVRQHGIVQAEAAGHEALGLGVIDAIYQPHELRHDVAMIPGRPEGVFGHRPSLGKDHQVDIRSEEHTSELQSRENLVCR